MNIHIGAGKRNFGDGWYNVDAAKFKHIHSHDIFNIPLPSASSSLIYGSHIIAYLDPNELRYALAEWRRLLTYNGVLRIATPDLKVLTRLYAEGKVSYDDIKGPLYGMMPLAKKYIFHKACYDFESLAGILNANGFGEVQRYNWRKTIHAEFDDHSQAYMCPKGDKETGTLISLNIECKKAYS